MVSDVAWKNSWLLLELDAVDVEGRGEEEVAFCFATELGAKSTVELTFANLGFPASGAGAIPRTSTV